jgi:hypothetical protein
LVNIIEDWDVLEEYAGEKLGFYQLLANDGKIEARVLTENVSSRKLENRNGKPMVEGKRKKGVVRVISPLIAGFNSHP